MSLVKEAQKMVLNLAAEMNMMLKVMDDFAAFGNRACHEHISKRDFFSGLELMRKAIYAEYCQAMANALVFSGVGGDESRRFVEGKFREYFADGKAIMQFLDKWGQTGSYYASDEERFRSEAQEIIAGFEGDAEANNE